MNNRILLALNAGLTLTSAYALDRLQVANAVVGAFIGGTVGAVTTIELAHEKKYPYMQDEKARLIKEDARFGNCTITEDERVKCSNDPKGKIARELSSEASKNTDYIKIKYLEEHAFFGMGGGMAGGIAIALIGTAAYYQWLNRQAVTVNTSEPGYVALTDEKNAEPSEYSKAEIVSPSLAADTTLEMPPLVESSTPRSTRCCAGLFSKKPKEGLLQEELRGTLRVDDYSKAPTVSWPR